MYITDVVSNVKKTCKVNKLGKRTLIVGNNGSGKSTITQSVELAMGGFASDLIGRDMVKKASELMALSGDGKTLLSKVIFSDGSISSFRTQVDEEGRTSRPVRRGKKGRFIFQEVEDHLTGSAAKAQSWLLDQAPISRQMVIAALEEEHKNLYGLIGDTLPTENEVTILHKAIERQKGVLKDSRARIHQLTLLIEEGMVREPDNRNTAKEQAEIEEKIQKLNTFLQEAYGKKAKKDRELASRNVKEEAEVRIKKIEEELAHWKKQIIPYKEQLQEVSSRVEVETLLFQNKIGKELEKTLQLHQEAGVTDRCLVCGNDSFLPSFEERREVMKFQTGHTENLYQLVRKRDNVAKHICDLISELEVARRDLEKCIEPRNQTDEDTEYQQLKDQIEEIQQWVKTWGEKTRSLQNLQRQFETIEEFRHKVTEAEKQKEKAVAFIADCQKAIKMFVSDICSSFSTRVNRFLPYRDVFELRIDQESNRCSFGFNRNGALHTALSGAEWVRMILAIGMATAKQGEFNVYIPQERAYDALTLKEMMVAFSKVEGQVFLTTTYDPCEAIKGWDLISLAGRSFSLETYDEVVARGRP